MRRDSANLTSLAASAEPGPVVRSQAPYRSAHFARFAHSNPGRGRAVLPPWGFLEWEGARMRGFQGGETTAGAERASAGRFFFSLSSVARFSSLSEVSCRSVNPVRAAFGEHGTGRM